VYKHQFYQTEWNIFP